MDLIKALNEKQLKEVPQILVGDTVRVHVKVKEGARERVQVFEGTVIAKKHGGIEETFTVRRISYGVGVAFQRVLVRYRTESSTGLRHLPADGGGVWRTVESGRGDADPAYQSR